MAEERYFRGQGKVYFATRTTAGQPDGFEFVGNVPELMTRLETSNVEHNESKTGRGLTDLRIETKTNGGFTLMLEKFDKRNLAKAMFGEVQDVLGATATAEPAIAKKGKFLKLRRMNLTSLTSVTNVGGATTYVADTDYRVNLRSGMVEILAAGAIADDTPLEANYVYGAQEKIAAFAKPNRYYWILFEGLNTVEDDAPVVVNLFKARFNPANEINWINNDDQVSQMQLEGSVLYDDLQPAPNRFMDITMVAEAA
jgi:hypothetical protein